MNESVFYELLNESYRREFAQYENAPIFKTSRKHNRVMKRIINDFENNINRINDISRVQLYKQQSMRRFSLKNVLVAALIVFLAIIAGCAVAYFASNNFKGQIHNSHTALFPTDIKDCPTVIEEKYNLSVIPEEFEIITDNSNPFSRTIEYMNISTKEMIVFSQHAKPSFGTINLDTEGKNIEEIEINGYNGLFLDMSNKDHIAGVIIWDNGDYIFKVFANLSKNELENLAVVNKIL